MMAAETLMSEGTVVVIIPALNEENTLDAVLRGIPTSINSLRTVTVVVDDGSTDRTAAIARAAGAVLLRHPRTLGVGAAFRTGVAWALEHGATVLANIDSDGQFDPADLPKLIAPITAGDADMVAASRFADPALTPDMSWIKKWGNHRMASLISALTRQKFHDVACGFRAYSRRAAASLNLTGRFTYTQEVFLSLAFRDFTIKEVPVRVRGTRQFGKSRVAKSLFKYALNTLKIILRFYRDYKPMRFFGTIATALICPGLVLWAFLLGHYLAAGQFSPHIWAGFAGATLVAFGLLALITGLLADMLDRIRMEVEEVLYITRYRVPGDPGADGGDGDGPRQHAG